MTDHTDLIAKLEAATEGGLALDWEIFLLLDPDAALHANLRPRHRYLYGERYTTSLDAKLPGEDIVEVSEIMRARPGLRAKRWMALQFGAREAAYAHTEALARRIAALKALGTGND